MIPGASRWPLACIAGRGGDLPGEDVVGPETDSMIRARGLGLLLPALLSTAGGCMSEPEDTLAVSCQGKCDGWSSIKSLWADVKKLDLGDLLSVSAGFATHELNDQLVTDWGRIKLGAPKLYALPERARDDLTLGNIDSLVTGLAARFGERELTTQVNALRRQHLRSSSDVVFGESAFSIDPSISPSWGVKMGGFDKVDMWFGFQAGGTLEARVIAAYQGELAGTLRSPLEAAKNLRGFVIPRSVDDLRKMKAGESFALKGAGRFGFNFGVGVPILVAEPTSWLTYSLVLSAGLRAYIDGQMDVQLVRVDGDGVVVDIGIEDGVVGGAKLALDDAWGIQGLVKSHVNIGPISVDLGRLVERALEKRLNAQLNLLSARIEGTYHSSRMSVARLRFSLDQMQDDGAPAARALAQALKGDVRLAQALSNRGEAGVVAEFDLSRSGVATTGYAGIDILGMSFFREVERAEGQVVIQTPGGFRTILFNSLHKASGWFFSSHGYTRVGLSGLVFDPARPGPEGVDSEANFFLQTAEGDDFMERDKLLDHLDGVILGVAGEDALAAVEKPGNQVETYVERACPNSQAFDPCRSRVLTDPNVVSLRQQAESALEGKLGALAQDQKDLVMAAGRLRIAAQATYEPHAQFVGPDTSVVLDYRLDDSALRELMTERSGGELRRALVDYLEAERIDRQETEANIGAERARIADRNKGTLEDLGALWEDHAGRYQYLLSAERASIDTIGEIGPRALEIRFTVDQDNRPVYEEATARAISQARAAVVTRLFDKMMKKAGSLGPHAEQSLAYALLSMTSPDLKDVRLDIDMDLSNGFSQDYDHYREAGYAPMDRYARGRAVSPIDGGLFSVDALLQLPK